MTWLIGNLGRTNPCHWLRPSLFSSLGASLLSGHELGGELGKGEASMVWAAWGELGKGKARWEASMVWAAETGVQC